MLKIGLAGGSGSGKGTVSSLLSQAGIPSFDCDAVYHDLISRDGPLTREIVKTFGEGVHSKDGGIDRRALADVVFHDKEKLTELNRITHKEILAVLGEWEKRAEQQGITAILVDAPLLFESGFDRECDMTVAVIAPTELRIERIVSRDGISRKEAEERIAAQLSDKELFRRADVVISNGEDLTHLANEVGRILSIINERRTKQ